MTAARPRRNQLGSFMNLPLGICMLCNINLTIREIYFTIFLEKTPCPETGDHVDSMTAMGVSLAKTFDTTIPQLSTPGVLKLKDRAVTRFYCVDTR